MVLSTGDPMLSGLGYLKGRVIPGISSLQVACARLKISQLKVVPITVHGRSLDPDAIAFELRRGKCVFLLTDGGTDLESLCRFLESQGLHREVAALSDLGYPEERIEMGQHGLPAPGPRPLLRFHRRILGIAALAGKIALPLCILFALEVNEVLRLYLQGIAAIRTVVLFRGGAANEPGILLERGRRRRQSRLPHWWNMTLLAGWVTADLFSLHPLRSLSADALLFWAALPDFLPGDSASSSSGQVLARLAAKPGSSRLTLLVSLENTLGPFASKVQLYSPAGIFTFLAISKL